ncbi:PAS domain-containing hybrid sensor histidine kinase/response regulator [Phyllobacterium sp. 628]|uniref:hybrid sensor histidine kinase/response regulator n=1 Tax=Phyllobacterium sp. 628 TaxID=2718938 RepID=UPI0016624F97|nr:PAS-domain containing protein [Phyllobacterium sp. 628]QND51875.1 PAS domain-containing hybrid sensor histidine kinase/response regulator [Phyllobacterium sp. 628]
MTGLAGTLVTFVYFLTQYMRIRTVDRRNETQNAADRPFVYALSVASSGSSWLFFGALGYAAQNGVEFVGLFIGIVLAFTIGFPFLQKVVNLAKSEGITSIADLIGARYGKSFSVTALVTFIATIGLIPYLSLQFIAIHYLYDAVWGTYAPHTHGEVHQSEWLLLSLLCFLSFFAILNTGKSIRAVDRYEGVVHALAWASGFKFLVFLFIGIAAIAFLFGTPTEILDRLIISQAQIPAIHLTPSIGNIIALILIGAASVLLLPSQFYLTVVENRSERELRMARWLIPVCLFITGLFVLPLAAIGSLVFHGLGQASPDLYFLSLPLFANQNWLSAIAFTGGISAASSMLVLPAIVLSIMISNDLVLPVLLRWSARKGRDAVSDFTHIIPKVRRLVIIGIMLTAYLYHFTIFGKVDFSELALISAVGMMQLVPPFVGGIIWRHATARGAAWGMIAGFIVWTYTMILPAWFDHAASFIQNGPIGIAFLRPHALFGLEASQYANGLAWSLFANLLFFLIGSFSKNATPLERIQASVFMAENSTSPVSIKNLQSSVTIGQLKQTISKYIGSEQAHLAFKAFQEQERSVLDEEDPADFKTVHFSEQLLSGIVGSPSARMILSLAMGPTSVSQRQAQILLDHATGALAQNRYLLQTALDQMDQGIGVFDQQYQLMCWNRQFQLILHLPERLQRMGTPFSSIISYLFARGDMTDMNEQPLPDELGRFAAQWRIKLKNTDQTIEIRSNAMPDGGLVTTFTDITSAVETDTVLRQTNEYLELRVRERTAELTLANQQLGQAQRRAEEANISKTRFLTDAGHDILQPLNAARLYSSALNERLRKSREKELVGNLDSSLEAVESIFNALLDISRLDAGALKPVISVFKIDTILQQIVRDFQPAAQEKGLELKLVKSSAIVATDSNLLRRLLQNLVSNAIKYCKSGKILVGARRRNGQIELQVIDTGIGIPKSKLNIIFREFSRLSEGMKESDGLGLGLSIVERIAKVLDLPIHVSSVIGKGTVFSLKMPISKTSTLTVNEEHPATERYGRLDGLVVLCVDDDERSLTGMKELLETWKCVAHGVSSGAALKEYCTKQAASPGVILADYNLKDENGLDLVRFARGHFDCHIQAALVTAERSEQLRDRAAAEDVSIINKPVRPAILRALLSHFQQTSNSD